LYINGKTTPVPFIITLQDCNPNVFNAVTVTFSGIARQHGGPAGH
jgi:type 1 fimbria pilin